MRWWSWYLLITLFATASVSAVLPRPKYHAKYATSYTIHRHFSVVHNQHSCFILDDAVKRFVNRLNQRPLRADAEANVTGMIYQLLITIEEECVETEGLMWPAFGMNESYEVRVLPESIDLRARQVWGIIRGLESVIQMVRTNPSNRATVILEQVVVDEPNYGYRGFLLDTANHYISLPTILKFLDAMSYVKMNVFHWHLVDSESFPYVSYSLPELSQKGAFVPYVQVYTHSEVKAVLEHARQRGIRVIPEFDSPGHTYSWGMGYPDLLTPCYTNGTPSGHYGPLNPTKNETFTALFKLFSEADIVFPDSFIHLGGDEVDYVCWRSNPDVQAMMRELGYDDDYSRLLVHYFDQIIKMVTAAADKRKRRAMVWQEVFFNGYRTDNQTIIHVWKEDNWKANLKQVTQAGFDAVLSSCWYLNLISSGPDWMKYYLCNPADFGGTEEEKKRVIGGAAAMWSGFVDDSNVIATSWTRGAVVAERLYSTTFDGIDEFAPRLKEMECHMKKWGIDAQPVIGSGFCAP